MSLGVKFCHGDAVLFYQTEEEIFDLVVAMACHLYPVEVMVYHFCLRVVVEVCHLCPMAVEVCHHDPISVEVCHHDPMVAMADHLYPMAATVYRLCPKEVEAYHPYPKAVMEVCPSDALEEKVHRPVVEVSNVVAVKAYH